MRKKTLTAARGLGSVGKTSLAALNVESLIPEGEHPPIIVLGIIHFPLRWSLSWKFWIGINTIEIFTQY